MADTKVSNFTDGVTANATDRLGGARSPFSAITDSIYVTPAYIDTYMASTTKTLTNKTINLTSNTLVATSAQLATALTDETGSGALVFANTPTFVTPVLGAATGTSVTVTGLLQAGTTLGISTDVLLNRGAANTLDLRNGLNAQVLNVFNTFTDASNYEKGIIQWSANDFYIGTAFAGTGAGRSLILYTQSGANIVMQTSGSNRWIFDSNGNLLAAADGTYDIGSGASDPRKLYIDQTITAGGTTGNQTINKAAGTVNIATAGTTVTVTNNLCTTSSSVFAVLRTNDATATIKNVVPGAGSFVITLGASATAEVSIGFWVLN